MMHCLNLIRRFFLKFMRDTYIQSLDVQRPHSVLVSRATYSPWYADNSFMCVYEAIRTSTLVDIYRCYELWSLISQVKNVTGDFLEVGVWRGGTSALIAKRIASLGLEKRLFLCDTFTGVVKTSDKDTFYKGGEHADTSEQRVMNLLAALDLTKQTELLVGTFPEETSQVLEQTKFAFCHIDVDSYLSAKDIFDWVAPRLSLHGVIVFDDYGFWGCDGVACLVEELAARTNFTALYNLNGHAVFIKVEEEKVNVLHG